MEAIIENLTTILPLLLAKHSHFNSESVFHKYLYAWDTPVAGVYGHFDKLTIVNESGFRLVDQPYNVGKVVGMPTCQRVGMTQPEAWSESQSCHVPPFVDRWTKRATERPTGVRRRLFPTFWPERC